MGENFNYFVWYFILFMGFMLYLGISYNERIDKKTNISPFRDKNSTNYKITREFLKKLIISFIIFLVIGFFLMMFLTLSS